jgi:hypothetical protein
MSEYGSRSEIGGLYDAVKCLPNGPLRSRTGVMFEMEDVIAPPFDPNPFQLHRLQPSSIVSSSSSISLSPVVDCVHFIMVRSLGLLALAAGSGAFLIPSSMTDVKHGVGLVDPYTSLLLADCPGCLYAQHRQGGLLWTESVENKLVCVQP